MKPCQPTNTPGPNPGKFIAPQREKIQIRLSVHTHKFAEALNLYKSLVQSHPQEVYSTIKGNYTFQSAEKNLKHSKLSKMKKKKKHVVDEETCLKIHKTKQMKKKWAGYWKNNSD